MDRIIYVMRIPFKDFDKLVEDLGANVAFVNLLDKDALYSGLYLDSGRNFIIIPDYPDLKDHPKVQTL